MKCTKDEINYTVSRFVVEIHKENGDLYQGKTLYELVTALQMSFETKGVTYKLLDDPAFM